MKPLFCPRCHKKIDIPAMFKTAKIVAVNGVTLKCGDGKCTGTVKFYPKVDEKSIEQSVK